MDISEIKVGMGGSVVNICGDLCPVVVASIDPVKKLVFIQPVNFKVVGGPYKMGEEPQIEVIGASVGAPHPYKQSKLGSWKEAYKAGNGAYYVSQSGGYFNPGKQRSYYNPHL